MLLAREKKIVTLLIEHEDKLTKLILRRSMRSWRNIPVGLTVSRV